MKSGNIFHLDEVLRTSGDLLVHDTHPVDHPYRDTYQNNDSFGNMI